MGAVVLATEFLSRAHSPSAVPASYSHFRGADPYPFALFGITPEVRLVSQYQGSGMYELGCIEADRHRGVCNGLYSVRLCVNYDSYNDDS